MPQLLYYPKINAPDPVIHQALLYWDRLATIVPPGAVQNDLFDVRMRQVADAGLYRPVDVRDWPQGDQEEIIARRVIDFDLNRRHVSREGRATSHVYEAKLSRYLRRILRTQAHISSGAPGPTIPVNSELYGWIMSTMVRDIAAEHDGRFGHLAEQSLVPHADSFLHHQLTHWPGQGAAHPCWGVEIGGLLPVPDSSVPLTVLLNFRQRHEDERRRLILAVNRLVHELQAHYEHPKDVFRAVQTEMEEALADLRQAGWSRGISWAHRSITIMIALASGYAGAKLPSQYGWLLGVVGGISINIATSQSGASQRQMSNDFTYLHRARNLRRGHHFS